MNGTDPRELLQAYLDDELPPAERERVDAALRDEPALREELARLRQAGRLARESAPPPMPAGFTDGLRAGVERAGRGWWEWLLPGPGRSLPPLVWGTVSTAVLAMVLYPVTETPAVRRDLYVTVNDMMTTTSDSYRAEPTTDLRSADALLPPPPPSAPSPATVAEGLERPAPREEHRAFRPPDAPAAPPPAAEPAAPALLAPESSPPPGGPAKTALDGVGDRVGAADVDASFATATGGERAKSAPARQPRAPSKSDEAPRPRLEAGEVDDNALFGKYVTYADGIAADLPVEAPTLRERYVIQVVTPDGIGLPDLAVRLLNGNQNLATVRTDSSGQAVWFPGQMTQTQDLVIAEVGAPDGRGNFTQPGLRRNREQGALWRLEAPRSWRAPRSLPVDLVFVIDTTGSMSEEIDRVRETVDQVTARIKELPSQAGLRLGLVLYRDRGDDYVTKAKPLTPSVATFRSYLQGVTANGGGDDPEDVNAALATAVGQLGWSAAPALRLAFLIGDAPPHLDYQEGVPYLDSVRQAAARGIKFYAVSSSGNGDLGEYVWRQVALLTRGRFVFITRGGAAGISTGATPHHVERQDYTVQALPDLILNAVARELAALGSRPEAKLEVTLPPAAPVVEPAPPIEPRRTRPVRHGAPRLPLWAFAVILAANFTGWLYAARRSRQPLQRG